MSWHRAHAYCLWVGKRLPTEAEWEKAYRAGTTTGYYNAAVNPAMCGACSPVDPNVDAIAWHCGNAAGASHPVGGKAQNAAGLRDMAGNVREWCHDWYQADLGSAPVAMPWGAAPGSASTRVARGGAFGTNAADVRAAAREHFPPGDRSASVGFRCVRH
jgi:formylglycine-generating enzyme required for sulfatase activity